MSMSGRWLQDGGGPERLNCSADRVLPPLRLAWKKKMGHYIHHSPLVSYGRVFAGSTDCTYRCWSLSDGQEQWCHVMDPRSEDRSGSPVENYPIPGAACLTENVAIVGSALGYFQGLALVSGKRLWHNKLSRTSEGTMLSIGDHVICSARSSAPEEYLLVSIEPTTGEFRWQKRLDMRCFSLTAKGNVAVGVLEKGKLINSSTAVHWGRIIAFDIASGQEFWHHEFPDHGMEARSLICNDMVIVEARGRGTVYALSLADGSILWTIPGQRMDAQPAVANGRLYIAADYLYAYDLATRQLIWKTKEGTRYKQSAPLVAGDYIFIGSGYSLDTEIHCRSAETGELVWRYKTGDLVFSTPTVAEGRLVVGSHDKHLYCFEGKSN